MAHAFAQIPRQVARRAAADRPVWFPGNSAPEWLDGSLAGDFGFDPLRLAEDKEKLRWYVQAELVNGRTAMMGIIGILVPSLLAKVGGFDFPQWYEAGKVYIEKPGAVPFNVLVVTQAAMCNFVEVKRYQDFVNPGSQGNGQILGITDDFKGVANGYPGGKFFDPMGFSRGSAESFAKWKQREIINARLAMLAMLGVFSQFAATDKGPLDNLADHLANPGYVHLGTNGISLPFVYGNGAP